MKPTALFLAAICSALGQGLNPAALLRPPVHTWPTYNGDYSGRRYSTLAQINRGNVKSLALAWSFQEHAAPLKCTPLEVNGILYLSAPDNVWAVDARTGREIWHFERPSEGDHIASRGVAIYRNRLYFGTPDAHLICLDARNGKVIWDKQIADVAFGYYLALAPLVVKDKVIIGTSGDSADVRHFIEALDPITGNTIWRWYTTPDPGTPAARTWPNTEAMLHGGGPAWLTGTYDPELNLLYWGTGNPHPVLAGESRAGANLYTCTIVALGADTGKLVWYYQTSPHDTHDWDSVETPVLFDSDFHGKPRKLLAQAARNGYFFLLDRTNGRHLLTAPFVPTDWVLGINAKGQPVPNPKMEPQADGSLVETGPTGATNWNAPSFDPQTGLFYLNGSAGYTVFYLSLGRKGKPEGHQGGTEAPLVSHAFLEAIDYRTGKIRWKRREESGAAHPGILTTAGHLLITADVSGNILALDPATGDTLWRIYTGSTMDSSPMTYQLDGRQYILTAAGRVLYAWSLPRSK